MIGVNSPVTVFNLIISDIVPKSSALTNPLRTVDTSPLVSIVIAAGVPLTFPGIVQLLSLVKILSEPIPQSTGSFYILVRRSLLCAFLELNKHDNDV